MAMSNFRKPNKDLPFRVALAVFRVALAVLCSSVIGLVLLAAVGSILRRADVVAASMVGLTIVGLPLVPILYLVARR